MNKIARRKQKQILLKFVEPRFIEKLAHTYGLFKKCRERTQGTVDDYYRATMISRGPRQTIGHLAAHETRPIHSGEQQYDFGKQAQTSTASLTILSISSSNEIPITLAALGTSEVLVIPGRVFTSRQYRLPRLSMRKSTRA